MNLLLWIVSGAIALFLLVVIGITCLIKSQKLSANNTYIPWDLTTIPELKDEHHKEIHMMQQHLNYAGFERIDTYKITPPFPEKVTNPNDVQETHTYIELYLDPKLNILATIYIHTFKKVIFSPGTKNETITNTIKLFLDSNFSDGYQINGITSLEPPLFPSMCAYTLYCTDKSMIPRFISDFQSRITTETASHPLSDTFRNEDITTSINNDLKEGYDFYVRKGVATYNPTTEIYRFKLLPALKAVFKLAKFQFFVVPKLRKEGCSFLSTTEKHTTKANHYIGLSITFFILVLINWFVDHPLLNWPILILSLIVCITWEILYYTSIEKFKKEDKYHH